MRILFYRFLDYSGSAWRRFWKTRRLKARFGARWKDFSRTGRVYSRVEFKEATPDNPVEHFEIRPEPGWLYACPNCHTTSLSTASSFTVALALWSEIASNAILRGYKAPQKPTIATAWCTECRFKPGDPE